MTHRQHLLSALGALLGVLGGLWPVAAATLVVTPELGLYGPGDRGAALPAHANPQLPLTALPALRP